MSSKNCEENGYEHDYGLLIISHQLGVSYPTEVVAELKVSVYDPPTLDHLQERVQLPTTWYAPDSTAVDENFVFFSKMQWPESSFSQKEETVQIYQGLSAIPLIHECNRLPPGGGLVVTLHKGAPRTVFIIPVRLCAPPPDNLLPLCFIFAELPWRSCLNNFPMSIYGTTWNSATEQQTVESKPSQEHLSQHSVNLSYSDTYVWVVCA